eukprot:233887-Lingulodinium_polyedra.AAC.1
MLRNKSETSACPVFILAPYGPEWRPEWHNATQSTPPPPSEGASDLDSDPQFQACVRSFIHSWCAGVDSVINAR